MMGQSDSSRKGSGGMDKIEHMLLISLLGLTVVMFVLFLLYLVFELFGRLLNRFQQKVAVVSFRRTVGALRRSSTAGPAIFPVPVETGAMEPALVAVVTAAIHSYLKTGLGKSPCFTPALRSEQAAGGWRLEGRRLQMGGGRRIDFLRRQWKGEKV